MAAEDLRQRLESGDVDAQDRRVTPGEGIEIIPLTPEDWQNGLLFPASPSTSAPCTARRISATTCCAGLTGPPAGHNIFLRRADVYRIWPIAGEAEKPPAEPPSKQLPPMRPKEITTKAWLVVSVVWALWGEGYRWPHQEALRLKVCERLGWDPKEDLSLPTLKTALAWLRKEDFIDL